MSFNRSNAAPSCCPLLGQRSHVPTSQWAKTVRSRPDLDLLKQFSIVVQVLTRLEPVNVLAKAISRPEIVDPSLDWSVDSCIDGRGPDPTGVERRGKEAFDQCV